MNQKLPERGEAGQATRDWWRLLRAGDSRCEQRMNLYISSDYFVVPLRMNCLNSCIDTLITLFVYQPLPFCTSGATDAHILVQTYVWCRCSVRMYVHVCNYCQPLMPRTKEISFTQSLETPRNPPRHLTRPGGHAVTRRGARASRHSGLASLRPPVTQPPRKKW